MYMHNICFVFLICLHKINICKIKTLKTISANLRKTQTDSRGMKEARVHRNGGSALLNDAVTSRRTASRCLRR